MYSYYKILKFISNALLYKNKSTLVTSFVNEFLTDLQHSYIKVSADCI